MRTRLVAVGVAVLCVASLAQAALVVYEPFDGYTAGVTLSGQMPTLSTIGIDKTVAYAGTSTTFKPNAQGLEFGDLATAGGSLQVLNTSNANPHFAGAKLSTSTVTGDLFVSYLVNIESQGVTYNGLGVHVSDANASGSNARLSVFADVQNSNLQRPGVGYAGIGSGTTNTTLGAADTGLVTGTTYLILAKFTNIGSTLTSGAPGVATLWALDIDQYNNIKGGGIDEAELTAANVTALASKSVTAGTYGFDNTKYINVCALGSLNPSEKAKLDEFRYGTTLADVIPTVPEPATLALLLGGLGLGLIRRRGV